jgi:rhamnosyltransferase
MNDNKEMLVSVIITAKNEKHNLEQSLPVLTKQKLDGKYELILIDSGSTDGSIQLIKKYSVKLIQIKPDDFNYAFAFNKCAKIAKGKYLVKLSGDNIPIDTSWLRELIKPFKDPMVGGTFGKYTITGRKGWNYPDYWPAERFPDKTTRYSEQVQPIGGISVRNMLGVNYSDPNRSHLYDFAGGCCAIRKSIWKKRPLNEKLSAAEDAEYSWFLHLIGYDIVYTPHAKVIHEHNINRLSKKPYLLSLLTGLGQNKMRAEIVNYWLKRLIGIDPYEDMRIN